MPTKASSFHFSVPMIISLLFIVSAFQLLHIVYFDVLPTGKLYIITNVSKSLSEASSLYFTKLTVSMTNNRQNNPLGGCPTLRYRITNQNTKVKVITTTNTEELNTRIRRNYIKESRVVTSLP